MRLVPLPPKVILTEGSRNGSAANARRDSRSGGVRSSLTMSCTTRELSSAMVWSAISPMSGGWLPGRLMTKLCSGANGPPTKPLSTACTDQ